MRWLYHVTTAEALEAGGEPESLAREGFIHASYRDAVRESAGLYFPRDARLRVLRVDPRRLGVPLVEATTPRGPMPHIHGAIPSDAVREVLDLDDVDGAPDRVTGTRVAFVAFRGMTLLDLVGVMDPVSRIASMDFDPTFVCEVVSADGSLVFTCPGAEVRVADVRPDLAPFDAVVVAGGLPARTLADDPAVAAWLGAFPAGRLMASVCTGALFLGAAGRLRGRRATTHASALDRLARYGAEAVRERVVDEGPVVTAGGVTAGIDLGLALVSRFEGAEVAAKVAAQMEWPLFDQRSSVSSSAAR